MSEGASPPPPKVDLLEMILWAEFEADDVEIWREVLRREGKQLWATIERRGQVARKVVETLTLLKEFEREFVQIVKMRREAQRRQGHANDRNREPARRDSAAASREVVPAQDDYSAVDAEPGSEID